MTKRRAMGSHHSARAKTETWLTPPEIISALGTFDLDPCAVLPRPWRTARAHYYPPIDGLKAPWRGRVWLNPPYGTQIIGAWLKRLADHGRGTALIFARTETENFVEQVWRRADGLLFLEGRLYFHRMDGVRAKANSGAPSVLVAYGPDDLDVLAGCGLGGAFVPLRLPQSYVIAALNVTWSQAILAWVQAHGEAVVLADLYRAFATHPKARRNRHYREQIRKVLQQGPFERVGRGRWQAGRAA